MKGGTIALLIGSALALYLLNKSSTPAAPLTVYRPPLPGTNPVTAAAITAGSGLVSSLISDIFGNTSTSGGPVYSSDTLLA